VSYIQSITRGVCVLASMFFVAVAGAAPVSWSNSSGSGTNFTWSNGANDNGLAGDPVTGSNFFLFIPAGLKAVATNGGSDSVSETIRVTLTPAAGMRITSINADFHGDATVFGSGSAGYTATLDAMQNGGVSHVSNSLSPAPITTQGAFNDNLSLAVPTGFGPIDFSLLATMNAQAGQGATALSEMKVIHFSVETAPQVVPLPAAIATFPIGAALVAFATRRMKKRSA
jgi:hypothetical protein